MTHHLSNGQRDSHIFVLDDQFSWWLNYAPPDIQQLHTRIRELQLSPGPATRVKRPGIPLPETTVRRVLLAGSRPQKILVIDDQGLLGPALSLRGHDVTIVTDAGERVGYLSDLYQQLGLEAAVRREDLCCARSPTGDDDFDVLFSPVVETGEQLECFLQIGSHVLQPQGFACVAVMHPAELHVQNVCRSRFLQWQTYRRDCMHCILPRIETVYQAVDEYDINASNLRQLASQSPETTKRHVSQEHECALHRIHLHDINPELVTIQSLESLFDQLVDESVIDIRDRITHQEYVWLTHAVTTTNDTCITLAINRMECILELVILPHEAELARRLHESLWALFKAPETTIETIHTRGRTDMRL